MLLITTVVFPPIYVVGPHWINPCKPSFLFYLLLIECNKPCLLTNGIIFYITGIFLKLMVFTFKIWALYIGLHGAFFVAIPGHIIGPMMIRERIQLFRKRFVQTSNVYAESVVYREFKVFNSLANCLQQNCLGLFITALIVPMSMVFSLLIASSGGWVPEANILLTGFFFSPDG